MHLQLYTFEHGGKDEERFPWDSLVAAFAPARIASVEGSEWTHWVLEHPVQPVRFYAPAYGEPARTVGFVSFDSDDVIELGDEGRTVEHPLWTGVYTLLSSWPLRLTVALRSQVARANVIARPEWRARLPSCAYPEERPCLVVEDRAQFDRMIAEGWALNHAYCSASRPRQRWADESQHDEEALSAFTNYVLGKRGKAQKLSWFDTPIPARGSGGSFHDHYGVQVDWREVDEEIVTEVAGRMLRPRLEARVTDTALDICFDGTTTTLTIDEIGTERYQTIRALNAALHPHFELRLVRKTAGSDTHCFLFAPIWLWQELERIDADKLDGKTKRIDARDGFSSPARSRSRRQRE